MDPCIANRLSSQLCLGSVSCLQLRGLLALVLLVLNLLLFSMPGYAALIWWNVNQPLAAVAEKLVGIGPDTLTVGALVSAINSAVSSLLLIILFKLLSTVAATPRAGRPPRDTPGRSL